MTTPQEFQLGNVFGFNSNAWKYDTRFTPVMFLEERGDSYVFLTLNSFNLIREEGKYYGISSIAIKKREFIFDGQNIVSFNTPDHADYNCTNEKAKKSIDLASKLSRILELMEVTA